MGRGRTAVSNLFIYIFYYWIYHLKITWIWLLFQLWTLYFIVIKIKLSSSSFDFAQKLFLLPFCSFGRAGGKGYLLKLHSRSVKRLVIINILCVGFVQKECTIRNECWGMFCPTLTPYAHWWALLRSYISASINKLANFKRKLLWLYN